ncbi:MAG: hypothetical protein JWQ98_424 [Chlorobi bacterium]|nr:hypothetical protein [Chlorobiota bacterium]
MPNGTLRWSLRLWNTWHCYNRFAPMGLGEGCRMMDMILIIMKLIEY